MRVEKGIILAGGSGTRLYPLTIASNKQLLPIYDKPLIYYPLTTLMLAGIRDILIISSNQDLPKVKELLGDGDRWGVTFSYLTQDRPNGLPEAFILGEEFIEEKPVAMILGDNFFHGHGLSEEVFNAAQYVNGAHIFTYQVEDSERFGIVTFDKSGNITDIEEKPKHPKSNNAITGLYYFDGSVSDRAKALKPSQRGELEITDLINSYILDKTISFTQLGRGYVWFDAGTAKSLLDTSIYVEIIQSRQGSYIASPEEIALKMGYIDDKKLFALFDKSTNSKYQQYLLSLVKNENY